MSTYNYMGIMTNKSPDQMVLVGLADLSIMYDPATQQIFIQNNATSSLIVNYNGGSFTTTSEEVGFASNEIGQNISVGSALKCWFSDHINGSIDANFNVTKEGAYVRLDDLSLAVIDSQTVYGFQLINKYFNGVNVIRIEGDSISW